jgi:hypothetical protein
MHPYKAFPDRQFWNRSVSRTPWADVFLDQPAKFKLAATDRIASAGSCFARRIAENLTSLGYNYEYFEPPHPLMAPKAAAYGYGVFSCRYGNIYSTRQLRQLFDEALGNRPPILRLVQTGPDAFLDLMRPNLGELGFTSAEEARLDRAYHLSRVRAMIEEMEVFVFTLGLTETWIDPASNVVYGSHPAVFQDSIPAEVAQALNLGYEDVVADLEYVLGLIARHNPKPVRVILTVSPVALAATHQPTHVANATSYSKAVLRAAAGKIAASHDNVDYFPSFEIFALSQSYGQYMAEDLRDVNPRGVAVAMKVFGQMFLAQETGEAPAAAAPRAPAPAAEPAFYQAPVDRECEEIANAFFDRPA